MSFNPPIQVRDLGKCYQTYSSPSHRLLQALHGTRKKLYEEFWALRDVNLMVEKGETLGIVGRNGSGKSTLLQLIAGTLTPTTGSISTVGRISALLELGAGFNPEFTGRENARLNASILGIEKAEFHRNLPDILAFSELEKFIDKPVKTYSSGMYVRLAFAVAINLRPDVLIIDEALAVGDVRFQRKCFRELQKLKSEGVTILFVTHSIESVVNHCSRAVYLDAGTIKAIGEPKTVTNQYLEEIFGDNGEQTSASTGQSSIRAQTVQRTFRGFNLDPEIDACAYQNSYNSSEYRWGDGRAQIIDYRLEQDGTAITGHTCHRGKDLEILAVIFFSEPFSDLIYGITVKTVDGTSVYGTNTRLQKLSVSGKEAGEIALIRFSLKLNLLAADYFISLGVALDDPAQDHIPLDRRYDMIHVKVEDKGDAFGLASLQGEIRDQADFFQNQDR
ncbi:MAG: ABC transporter ATP-binding protein [Gammaproteobacteria bacterium]|nr:ABC transporter ATP-binding protein [Gammaproteobacteria bacterium]